MINEKELKKVAFNKGIVYITKDQNKLVKQFQYKTCRCSYILCLDEKHKKQVFRVTGKTVYKGKPVLIAVLISVEGLELAENQLERYIDLDALEFFHQCDETGDCI